jgi:hypothetical protein
MRAIAAAAVLLASAPECADLYSVAARGFTAPEVEVSSAGATRSGEQLHVELHFAAKNKNNFPLTVSSVDYRVELAGLPAYGGNQPGVTVAENASGALVFAGSLGWGNARPVLERLRGEATTTYRLVGTVHCESPAGVPVDVEFDTTGDVQVPELPASP